MTKLTLLNQDNKKMTGGGNVKQGLRPLATGFFGFRMWPKKKASYSGVRFVGETTTSSPCAQTYSGVITTGEIGEQKIGYSSEGFGSITPPLPTIKCIEITDIYVDDAEFVFKIKFASPVPTFTSAYFKRTSLPLPEHEHTLDYSTGNVIGNEIIWTSEEDVLLMEQIFNDEADTIIFTIQ